MSNIQFAVLSIPAGQQIPFSLYGDFIYCRSSTALFNVQGMTTDNRFPLEAGAKARLTDSEKQYYFINDTGSDITATILYGEGDYELDKFVGDVTVVNASPIDVDVQNFPTQQEIRKPSISSVVSSNPTFRSYNSSDEYVTSIAANANRRKLIIILRSDIGAPEVYISVSNARYSAAYKLVNMGDSAEIEVGAELQWFIGAANHGSDSVDFTNFISVTELID